MTDRRYGDDEMREIFDRASNPAQSGPQGGSRLTTGTGFTLAELQEIGAEAGIEPARIAEAAQALERGRGMAAGSVRRSLVPVKVSHSVRLPGPFTEEAWNRLVLDLRDTFEANGKLRVDGAFREWRNGNLYAAVEPDGDAYRLRLGSRKESAQLALTMGAVMAVMGAILFLLYATGLKEGALGGAVALELFALAGVGVGLLQLPGWAGRRAEQMEGIAARALLRAAEPSPSEAGD